ncbi:NAD(P)(+) transhydrogenase (Re/Si-specific) subunit beta [Mesorhizobium sp. M2A.F.Ca.ET.039.01.1.1]|uniref:NAD(P)(+) transhydrogenase (Re/Si-specific) subunit beta n=1 Tax=Mesorhizobium sp. M2A.F.Ca.ET.039.01.1.1 TaxID=2496746 RepID=UPI000FCBC593|nr:NAD(P)(+) transhydrogenase (Re/Si-specific) subunit beta [Mesorhizobium sp. M2A.F.Ca.ET.039.01.1.1]RWX68855.1 hypothetical protein EOA24_12685 [Mesorhizobium sp. M2A.F.Ca.ET.039.01.1.1]
MTIGSVLTAYIAAVVPFILSLDRVAEQENAAWRSIVGMGLAVLVTVFGTGVGNWLVFVRTIAGRAVRGSYVAACVQKTKVPQLVAALR